MLLKNRCSLDGQAAVYGQGFNEAGKGTMWQDKIANEIVLFNNDTGHLFCFVIPLKLIVFILSIVNYLLALYI